MTETLSTMSSVGILSAAPVLEPWQAMLGPLRLGPGTPYEWASLAGLEELPSLRTSDEARPWAHGDYAGDDWASGRTIGWELEIAAEPELGVTYDQALADLRRAMVPTAGDLIPLWVYIPHRGAPVRWDVKVRRHRVTTDMRYELGLALAEAQVYAPDPLGYGDELSTSSGFPLLNGGLEFDLFTDGADDTGFLEFGDGGGSSGRVVLTNIGTADTWPRFRTDGPVVDGFELLEIGTGRRLRFEGDVAAGSSISIDAATGVVLLDDVADRSGLLTVREWFPVPAGGTAEVMFLPLGSYTTAQLTVTWAPASW
ncbi:hypothetical protein [Cellulosimicrobium protaetiae]